MRMKGLDVRRIVNEIGNILRTRDDELGAATRFRAAFKVSAFSQSVLT